MWSEILIQQNKLLLTGKPTFSVENQHEGERCDGAFDALERTVSESEARRQVDTLPCTCPHGAHSGTVIVEVETAEAAESFARRWDVGEPTVDQLTEMEIR